MRYLSSVKKNLEAGQHIVQGGVSIWRALIFIVGALIVNVCNGVDAKDFFSPKFSEPYKINLIVTKDFSYNPVFFTYFANVVVQESSFVLIVKDSAPLYVLAIQAVCAIITYQACKYLVK